MPEAQAAQKPAYLGLLNAISLAESEAGVYLEAWANATQDEELACTLRLVALRESHHGDAFCRRVQELGFSLREKPDPKAAARLAKYANPRIPDCEKIPPPPIEARDGFKEIEKAIRDGMYDPMTANMLSWYIAEERDSGRRLDEAYACVRAKMNGETRANSNGMASSAPSADAQAIMACMSDGFARLEKSMEKLAKAMR